MSVKFKNTVVFVFLFFSIRFFSQEKIIIDIVINGTKKLDTTFVKKLLLTQKGSLLDSVSIEKDILLLKRMPAVNNADYQVINSDENFYKLLINIKENYTIIPVINFWTTTNQQFSYKLGVYDYNFLGKNMSLGGFYQNNGFNTYAINFRALNLFSKKWGLAVNHQNWKSEEPLYFGEQSANYLYHNTSLEILGLYQINVENEIDFGINLFNEKYQYLSGLTNPSIPQYLNLNKKLFKLIYTFNQLNYDEHYVTGFKSMLFAQFVTSKKPYQNDFFIAWNDFFYYKKVGANGNWAIRLRFGLSSNEKTPFAPFALDNNVNLRGVGILVDRGTGSFVLNSEYRYTVYNKNWVAIQTNVFSDIGSWRNPGGELSDFFKQKNLKMYSGVGLRFISKKIYNATFRIDYGFSILNTKRNSKGGFVFGIGQYF